MDDLQALVCRPGVAIVDSMLTLRWRDLVRWVPQARFAVVLRDEDEVLRSLRNIGFASPAVTAMVQRIRHEAKVFAKLHRVYQVTYVSLNRMEPCVNLHKRLTGLECDEAKWQHFMQRNIQVNPKLVTENARQNMAGIFDVYPEMLGVLSMASASA
jgi:hypothetical protein